MKHNILDMKQEEIEALKSKLVAIGVETGKPSGEAAGREAASKIDIPKILERALSAAKKAADDA